MITTRIQLGIVCFLTAGVLASAQSDFSGNAEISLQFIPSNPSVADKQLEVRIVAELGNVQTSDGADPILTDFSMPIGFDPSYVRLLSVAAGAASGFSSGGLAYTDPKLANGRGVVTILNSRESDLNPGTQVELGRLLFQIQRPGNASFTAGSVRTIHPGTLAAVPEDSGMPTQRVSWTDQEYAITIRAGAEMPSLICPSWFSTPNLWQGMALMNEGSEPASIQMLGWGPDGALVDVDQAENPSSLISLLSLNQHACLADQIFASSGAMNVEDGWIEAKANTPNVTGFFLQGFNGPEGEIQKMDGVPMTYLPASRLIFPLVRDPGRTSEISLANPGNDPVDMVLRVLNPTGEVLRTVSARVPAHGVFVEAITDATNEYSVYVDVQATGGKLVGTERFGTNESLAALSGQDVELASTRLSGPQFASGFLGGTLRMDTHLALVNPSAVSTTVILRLLNEGGQEIAAPVSRTLSGGSLLSVKGYELFGLPNPNTTSALTVGTVSIESDQGIIGAMSFGDPVRAKYLAALPLMSTASARREIFFKQVAVGRLENIDYFTGLALVNPSPTNKASINLELHGADGKIIAQTTTPFSLIPGGRYAALAQQLIPDFPDSQFGGYIRVTSDVDVHAYMLIGDNHYNFLSAVQ